MDIVKKVTVPDVVAMKRDGKRITMMTAYDAAFARLVEHLAVAAVGLGFDGGLDSDVPARELVTVHRSAQQWEERSGDPALPVDERAVAVEGDPVDRYVRRLARREAGHALRHVTLRPAA